MVIGIVYGTNLAVTDATASTSSAGATLQVPVADIVTAGLTAPAALQGASMNPSLKIAADSSTSSCIPHRMDGQRVLGLQVWQIRIDCDKLNRAIRNEPGTAGGLAAGTAMVEYWRDVLQPTARRRPVKRSLTESGRKRRRMQDMESLCGDAEWFWKSGSWIERPRNASYAAEASGQAGGPSKEAARCRRTVLSSDSDNPDTVDTVVNRR